MVMVKGARYTKLECVGRGGSSKVFKVDFDLSSFFIRTIHWLSQKQ